MYTLIAAAKLNGVDPQAWFAGCCAHRRSSRFPAARAAPLALEAPPNLSRRRLKISITALAGCLRF